MPNDWFTHGFCHAPSHPDPDLQRELGQIFNALTAILTNQVKIMATIDDVVSEVAAQSTVIDSLDTLLTNIAAQIAALKSTQTDPATAAKIDALATSVQANSDRISADVVKNTPAA